MLIKNTGIINNPSNLSQTCDEVSNFLALTPGIEFIEKIEYSSSNFLTLLSVNNSDYLLGVNSYYSSFSRCRIMIYNQDNTPLIELASYWVYDWNPAITMESIAIKTDYLLCFYLKTSSNIDKFLFANSKCDEKFYFVEPLYYESELLSFDKIFFSKPTINNQNILIPARMKNTNNKLKNINFSGVYFCSGLIDNTFYKFSDGEYGYYNKNILYK